MYEAETTDQIIECLKDMFKIMIGDIADVSAMVSFEKKSASHQNLNESFSDD